MDEQQGLFENETLNKALLRIADSDEEIVRLRDENKRLMEALSSIEKSARLSSDAGRAHSAQISYRELLREFHRLAAEARLAQMQSR